MSDKPIIVKTQKTQLVDKWGNPITPPVKYDSIQTMQQAINMAVGENRVVRFKSTKSTLQLKSEIVDIKGCSLRKPSKESDEIAVIPAGIEDFCFEDEIDTSLIIKRNIL